MEAPNSSGYLGAFTFNLRTTPAQCAALVRNLQKKQKEKKDNHSKFFDNKFLVLKMKVLCNCEHKKKLFFLSDFSELRYGRSRTKGERGYYYLMQLNFCFNSRLELLGRP